MLDIEKLMREGKSLDEIGKMVTDELNAAQDKLLKEKQAEAEAVKLSKKKADMREAAVAAVKTYYALVYPKYREEDLESFAKTAIDSIAKSIEMVESLKDVTINYNGKPFSFFEIF